MWDDVVAGLASGRTVVAGVLSGTSADGIDVGLARPTIVGARSDGDGGGHGGGEAGGGLRVARVECVAFATEPFEVGLGARLRGLLEARAEGERGVVCGLGEVALLDRDLGRAFGRAARAVAARHGYELGLVASHGQTVWHHDGRERSGAATLQLGDGDEVAEAAGAPVACDFRRRDIAAGGEGAPLSALADPIVFADAPRPLAVLNLGGIANLTLVRGDAEGGAEGPGGAGRLRAFDVGPANALLDGLARRLLGRPFDLDGAVAGRGRAREDLVAAVLRHPFFQAAAPKSTGRDTFGADWLAGIAAEALRLGLGVEDTLASAAVAIARSVARDLAAHERVSGTVSGPGRAPAPLYVAGGGVHHRPLMAALASELAAARGGLPGPGPEGGHGPEGIAGPARGAATVASSAAVGVPPDARESLVFAVLGVRCLLGEPSTDPGATGARGGRVLGKLASGPARRLA